MDNNSLEDYLLFATQTAIAAGKIVMRYYGKKLEDIDIIEEEHKGIVTIADEKSDQHIRAAIRLKFPGHGILSEEGDLLKGNDYQWVADSLDGTNNFLREFKGFFSVSLALRYLNEPIVGVVHLPARGETYTAIKGKGAFLEKDGVKIPIHVSEMDENTMYTLSFAVVSNFPDHLEQRAQILKGLWDKNLVGDFRTREFESTAYELCLVAMGKLEAHFNPIAQPWDIAAGELIVKEAGGQFTYIDKKVILASNGYKHEEFVDIIKSVY